MSRHGLILRANAADGAKTCSASTSTAWALSTLKHWLRKAKERSIGAINERIGEILKRFPAKYCESYFRNAGYGSV